jgi:hypothetical protein
MIITITKQTECFLFMSTVTGSKNTNILIAQ